MKYSDLITKRKQYKYSANICFDLENENRLSGFIPNVTTTEILKEYLCGIIQDKDGIHSRILYGSYGTGKSHLLTVLCALLGHVNTDKEAFAVFSDAIGRYDEEFASFISDFVQNEKPYVVVPVYSDFSDFDKCISYSLKKELERKGIEICFKNTFYEALDLISKWEAGEESKERLLSVCNNQGLKIEEIKNSLQRFEASSEKEFNLIFKEMTYGASFVSEVGSLIDNLNQAIVRDTISPTMTVDFSTENLSIGNKKYYSKDLVATFRIKEANFNREDVNIRVIKDGNGSDRANVNWTDEADDVHVGTVTISAGSGSGNDV